MKKMLSLLLAGVMACSAVGCGADLTSAEGGAEGETELNIYMWPEYISDALIERFEEENNCTVNLSYMEDNADAVEKLMTGGQGYDLIMTCDAYMDGLIEGEHLEKLGVTNIPNTSNIKDAYWRNKSYCVPYLMNYIYVVYDVETCPIEINGYNDLLDPALKGKISSIDGARNLFPIALIALGYDPNSTEASELTEAYEWLKKFDENVAVYGHAEEDLVNGTVSVAVTYDGNASWAMEQKKTVKIAPFTRDKIQLGVDLFVMPEGAEHVELAKAFLHFICDPEVMAENLEEYPYSCPNEAAVFLASAEYRNDPARDFDYKDRVFFQKSVGDAEEIYQGYYQQLVAARE